MHQVLASSCTLQWLEVGCTLTLHKCLWQRDVFLRRKHSCVWMFLKYWGTVLLIWQALPFGSWISTLRCRPPNSASNNSVRFWRYLPSALVSDRVVLVAAETLRILRAEVPVIEIISFEVQNSHLYVPSQQRWHCASSSSPLLDKTCRANWT